MKEDLNNLSQERERKIERIIDRMLITIDAKWPDLTHDHLAFVKKVFIDRLMNSARVVAWGRIQKASASVPDGLLKPGELTALQRLKRQCESQTGVEPEGANDKSIEFQHLTQDSDPLRPGSSEEMIEEWKTELREEMEENLVPVFAAMEKLAFLSAEQMCATQETTDICLGINSDDESVSYEGVEIPDQALSALIAHSELSEEEHQLLRDNDTGTLSRIQYQLCLEVLLGK